MYNCTSETKNKIVNDILKVIKKYESKISAQEAIDVLIKLSFFMAEEMAPSKEIGRDFIEDMVQSYLTNEDEE